MARPWTPQVWSWTRGPGQGLGGVRTLVQGWRRRWGYGGSKGFCFSSFNSLSPLSPLFPPASGRGRSPTPKPCSPNPRFALASPQPPRSRSRWQIEVTAAASLP